jgi:hypothetical protein
MTPIDLSSLNAATEPLHVLHFYQDGRDFLDLSARFILAGLEAGEGCIWVAAQPWTATVALSELRRRGPSVQECLDRQQLHIVPSEDLYGQKQNSEGVPLLESVEHVLQRVQNLGWPRIRACGNVFQPLSNDAWEYRLDYEKALHACILRKSLLALCSYRSTSMPESVKLGLMGCHHVMMNGHPQLPSRDAKSRSNRQSL